ncbi:MAG: DUF1599 domain-containing protein [Muribaculaceae bacterium]|nr:DUF1599 domain-containing protein [Muribaculaceae bacterium]
MTKPAIHTAGEATPDFPRTERQFDKVIGECREVFASKLRDYGASWRLMRPTAVTDQILIKADRIRSLETKGESRVDEPVDDAFRAIVNYGIIGLIQLQLGYADRKDVSPEEALALYDRHMSATRDVMLAKNHDYNEAWRKMRVSSYTDLILMKLMRTKEIEDNMGHTEVSEGIDANYQDMINYAVFGLIKLAEAARPND